MLSDGLFETLFDEYIELLILYNECRLKHTELSDWVREAYNED